MNAMGYNVGDNFLYATANDLKPYNLVRISGAGDCTVLGGLTISSAPNCGEVDENSQYWASASGQAWVQIDLKPGSTTYGRQVSNGVASPSGSVVDWAYVPKKGNFLWGLAYDSTSPGSSSTYLLKFDRSSKTWSTVTKLGDIAGSSSTRNVWGAVYATDDGFLFGSENNSGEIWKFPIPDNGVGVPSGSPVKISNGPISSGGNDGARCIKASNI